MKGNDHSLTPGIIYHEYFVKRFFSILLPYSSLDIVKFSCQFKKAISQVASLQTIEGGRLPE